MRMLSHRQITRKGGLSTLARHGIDHFKKIGKKGSETVLEKYGPDYYRKLSQAGVRARIKKYNEMHKIPLDNATKSMVK